MPSPAVFVFVQDGCGACHDYLPKFNPVAAEYKARGLPVGVYDIAQYGWGRRFAERFGVNATPTTVVMTSRGAFRKHVGSLGVREIRELFTEAV